MRFHNLAIYVGGLLLLLMTACHRGVVTNDGEVDTLMVADSLVADSLVEEEEKDEGLSLEDNTIELFGDFFFAFTHNTRFQANRIKFPLHVTELDGTERTVSSGRQFRSEFNMPEHDYYTLLLNHKSQMQVLQNDSLVDSVQAQFIDLAEGVADTYTFCRRDGRWQLTDRRVAPLAGPEGDFLRFYHQFVSDSLFQMQCLEPQLKVTMPESDDEEEMEEEIVGTIDRDQWPAFRPEMPEGRFLNLNFGQQLPDASRVVMLQCGFSSSMMDFFTFRQHGERWRLEAYEN